MFATYHYLVVFFGTKARKYSSWNVAITTKWVYTCIYNLQPSHPWASVPFHRLRRPLSVLKLWSSANVSSNQVVSFMFVWEVSSCIFYNMLFIATLQLCLPNSWLSAIWESAWHWPEPGICMHEMDAHKLKTNQTKTNIIKIHITLPYLILKPSLAKTFVGSCG